jgi:hypothetical protein
MNNRIPMRVSVAPAVLVMLLLTGCETIPIAKQDTYDICKSRANVLPPPTDERVAMGVLTLGLSELAVASDKSDLQKIESEMTKRGLNDCSAEGQARYECSKLYGEQKSKEFQSCVLSMKNSITARLVSDRAAAQAAAAQAAAINAQLRANQAKAEADRKSRQLLNFPNITR